MKSLSKKQLAVINDLFQADMNESEILKKHSISQKIYNKWLSQNIFHEEFARRIDAAYRQSELIMAKYAPLAAIKLVHLTESEKDETRRKACLDIISLPKADIQTPLERVDDLDVGITEEMAEKLLDAIAKE